MVLKLRFGLSGEHRHSLDPGRPDPGRVEGTSSPDRAAQPWKSSAKAPKTTSFGGRLNVDTDPSSLSDRASQQRG